MSVKDFGDLFGTLAPTTALEASQLAEALAPVPCPPEPSPRTKGPNNTRGIGPVQAPQSTLAASLYPVADALRQLLTDFGMRPYRMFSVVYRWSGGRDGQGTPEIVSQTEFLPTPFVDLRPLRSEIRNAGEVEAGEVTIREISPSYTEVQIKALFPRALQPGEVAFVEVVHDARDGITERRRITIADVPWRDPDAFGWTVTGYVQRTQRDAYSVLHEPPTLYPEGS